MERFLGANFSYFPISFNPPSDNPYGITEDKLKSLCRDVFLSCGHKHLFNLLFDKISSSDQLPKIEAYTFLTDNWNSFDQDNFIEHLDIILNTLIMDTDRFNDRNKSSSEEQSLPDNEHQLKSKYVCSGEQRKLNQFLAACCKFFGRILSMPKIDQNLLELIFSYASNNLQLLSGFGEFQHSFDFAMAKIFSLRILFSHFFI